MRWDRIGRVALVLVLFGVLVSLPEPRRQPVRRLAGLEGGRGAVGGAEGARTLSLGAQVERASDPLTLEREARKLGMVKPGERAYVIEGLGD